MPTTKAKKDEPRRLVYMKLSDVVPAARNPKGHHLPTLSSSMARFGFIDVISMDERTGRLVSGHGRVETLQQKQADGTEPPEGVLAGDDDWLVPVVRGWASVDDDEAEAAIVALNEGTILGGWENDNLAALLDDLRSRGGADALIGTGFDDDRLDALLASLRTPTFDPVGQDDQPRLDQRAPVECPNCGHVFEPKRG